MNLLFVLAWASLIVAAVFLAMKDREGWGWFLFVALLTFGCWNDKCEDCEICNEPRFSIQLGTEEESN